MSGVITRLAARALDTHAAHGSVAGNGIRPRLPARFEHGSMAADLSSRELADVPSSLTPHIADIADTSDTGGKGLPASESESGTAGEPDAAAKPLSAEAPGRHEPRKTERRLAHSPGSTGDPPRPLQAAISVEPGSVRVVTGTGDAVALGDSPPSHGDRAPGGDSSSQLDIKASEASAVKSAPAAVSDHRHVRDSTTIERTLRAEKERTARRQTLRPALAESRSRTDKPGQAAGEQDTPEIIIRIGRIDVRAETASKSKTQDERPRRAMTSLADYLARSGDTK